MSKYFKRSGSPSTEEIISAIRDIEERLDEIDAKNGLSCSMRELTHTVKGLENSVTYQTQRIDDCKESLGEHIEAILELKDGRTKLQ